jgi:hypothetical protein
MNGVKKRWYVIKTKQPSEVPSNSGESIRSGGKENE